MEGRDMFGTVKYLGYPIAHPRIPKSSMTVSLVAYADYLAIHSVIDSEDLVLIPWMNLKGAYVHYVRKRGFSAFLVFLMDFTPLPQNSLHTGLAIEYWDEHYQRDFQLFFKTGNQRKAEDLMRIIWKYRDDFMHRAGQAGRPQ